MVLGETNVIAGGLSAAGRGLFIGSWLGAVVEAFHIHLRETTKEALRLESLHKLEEVRVMSVPFSSDTA